MDNAVFWRDCWLSQLRVVELYSVIDADSLGGGIYEFVATVVVEGQAYAESITSAEVP